MCSLLGTSFLPLTVLLFARTWTLRILWRWKNPVLQCLLHHSTCFNGNDTLWNIKKMIRKHSLPIQNLAANWSANKKSTGGGHVAMVVRYTNLSYLYKQWCKIFDSIENGKLLGKRIIEWKHWNIINSLPNTRRSDWLS